MLKFGVPSSDTCAYCDRLYIKWCPPFKVTKKLKLEKLKSFAADAIIAKESPNKVVIYECENPAKTNVNDEDRSGRPSLVSDDLVNKVDEKVRENQNLWSVVRPLQLQITVKP
ncbi:hypothetical protein J6590_061494 [Homalodisca vitripennis]|nr:hypothetical protein J6590_061494 [Homalodisca vitripennis]